MTRLRKIAPLVLAGMALLFSCVSCFVPFDIWNMSILPRVLMFYGEYPTRITVVILIVLLVSLVLLLMIKPIDCPSTIMTATTILVLLSCVVMAYTTVQNALFENIILSSVSLGDHVYHLTEHSRLDFYCYNLYECDRADLMCHHIPFAIPQDSGSPQILRVDTGTNTLYVLDWCGEIIYEHKLPD